MSRLASGSKKDKKIHIRIYLGSFSTSTSPRGTSSMGPTTGPGHATYRRCHDIAEDEPIIMYARTEDRGRLRKKFLITRSRDRGS